MGSYTPPPWGRPPGRDVYAVEYIENEELKNGIKNALTLTV
jgi:hypothetical protein